MRVLVAVAAAALLWGASAARARDCSADSRELLRSTVLRVAYYPYSSALHTYLDLSSVPEGTGLVRADVELSRNREATPVRRFSLPVSRAASPGGVGRVFALPPLEPGRWEVRVIFRSAACRGLAGPTESFAVRRFAWEHNALGDEPEVIPPFEPLTTHGRHVRAVLRDHELDDFGLWRQVKSLDENLLARPIALELAVDGAPVTGQPSTPVVLRRISAGRIDSHAVWRAGELEVQLDGRYEVDGLTRFDLVLRGAPQLQLSRLDLVIPLRPAQAKLLNAVTDGTLHNTIGALPARSGKVWDSTQTGRVDLPPEFVPYIWIGTEERGLSFLAASARDWMLAAGRPAEEIRTGETSVDLVVHFVTQPGAILRERHISFALQATPVKPRRADWRRIQVACELPFPAFRLCPLPAGGYWGSPTPYGSYAPRGDDWSLFEQMMLARRGTRVRPGFVGAWLRKHATPSPEWRWAATSLDYTFYQLASKPDAVVAYVNAHKSAWGPEFEVYTDEWRPVPFGDRAGRDESAERELAIVPVRSWQDFALSQMDRMLATDAVDGFYFDNTYLRASFDEVVGNAYRDDAGQLQPGVDLFELREFLMRAQKLAWKHRGSWLSVSHMTTTPIAAIQGWAAATLDGEWKYGRDDYQDRFSNGALRAGSLGTQSGTVPVFLPGLVGPQGASDLLRLERSLIATTAVHEIRIMANLSETLAAPWRQLLSFGYGRPECAVRRYWDRAPGFALSGVPAKALLVRCGERTLALVASFGGGGDVELALDARALGIRSGGVCFDAERGGPEPRQTSAGCRFHLEGHGYRMIGYGPRLP